MNDLDTIVGLCSAGPVLMPQGASALAGRVAVRAGYDDVLNAAELNVCLTAREIEIGHRGWARTGSVGRTRLLAAGAEGKRAATSSSCCAARATSDASTAACSRPTWRLPDRAARDQGTSTMKTSRLLAARASLTLAIGLPFTTTPQAQEADKLPNDVPVLPQIRARALGVDPHKGYLVEQVKPDVYVITDGICQSAYLTIQLRKGQWHSPEGDLFTYPPGRKFLMAIDTLAAGHVPFMDFDLSTHMHAYLKVFDELQAYVSTCWCRAISPTWPIGRTCR